MVERAPMVEGAPMVEWAPMLELAPMAEWAPMVERAPKVGGAGLGLGLLSLACLLVGIWSFMFQSVCFYPKAFFKPWFTLMCCLIMRRAGLFRVPSKVLFFRGRC